MPSFDDKASGANRCPVPVNFITRGLKHHDVATAQKLFSALERAEVVQWLHVWYSRQSSLAGAVMRSVLSAKSPWVLAILALVSSVPAKADSDLSHLIAPCIVSYDDLGALVEAFSVAGWIRDTSAENIRGLIEHRLYLARVPADLTDTNLLANFVEAVDEQLSESSLVGSTSENVNFLRRGSVSVNIGILDNRDGTVTQLCSYYGNDFPEAEAIFASDPDPYILGAGTNSVLRLPPPASPDQELRGVAVRLDVTEEDMHLIAGRFSVDVSLRYPSP